MKWIKIIFITVLLLVVIYFIGPHPATPNYSTTLPNVPSSAKELIQFVQQEELKHTIKPNNEARIIWNNDSLKNKTDYAIVYLHGFSASQQEGSPVHEAIAKQFGCNLYLARLSQHGIDTTEELVNLTPENYWQSAQEAYAIGKQLGKKVILMGTSTGATLALQLASVYPEIAGIILLSPNIEINDSNAWLLNNPWGLQIARLVLHSNYKDVANDKSDYKQYWNTHYRLEAVVSLEELIETTMTNATFKKIHQPMLLLYYYKDPLHQDNVVKVSAMLQMFNAVATPDSLKIKMPIPNAGNHVLASPIVSKDIETSKKEIAKFLTQTMHLSIHN